MDRVRDHRHVPAGYKWQDRPTYESLALKMVAFHFVAVVVVVVLAHVVVVVVVVLQWHAILEVHHEECVLPRRVDRFEMDRVEPLPQSLVPIVRLVPATAKPQDDSFPFHWCCFHHHHHRRGRR
jgi:hypothetical protein